MASSVLPRDDSNDRVGAFSHAIKPEELKAGDHIYVYRALGFFAHHGIYVDEEEVIHFSGPKGSGSKSEAKISAVSLKEFLYGSQVRLVAYESIDSYKRYGTAHYEKSQPTDRVISTAKLFLKYPELWLDYHFFHMNCENFAYYCKTNCLKVVTGQSCTISLRVSVPSIVPTCSEHGRICNVLKEFKPEEEEYQAITCYVAELDNVLSCNTFGTIMKAIKDARVLEDAAST